MKLGTYINLLQHAAVIEGISFFLKMVLLLMVLSVERVVGYPIIASYIFWSFSERDKLYQQIILIFLFSISLSALYAMDLLVILSMLGAGKLLLSFGFFRKQKMLRISASTILVICSFWLLGMQPGWTIAVYASIQILVLLAAQLRRGWYRRATW